MNGCLHNRHPGRRRRRSTEYSRPACAAQRRNGQTRARRWRYREYWPSVNRGGSAAAECCPDDRAHAASQPVAAPASPPGQTSTSHHRRIAICRSLAMPDAHARQGAGSRSGARLLPARWRFRSSSRSPDRPCGPSSRQSAPGGCIHGLYSRYRRSLNGSCPHGRVPPSVPLLNPLPAPAVRRSGSGIQ